MTSPRITHKPSGGKGFSPKAAFVAPKSGADLFREGAPLSACLTKNQEAEWLAAEAAEIAAYLAEEKANVDLRRSLAYLDGCMLEGMPAASACAVLC